MNIYDILILAVVAVVAGMAIRRVIRNRKAGGGCSCGCGGSCPHCGQRSDESPANGQLPDK